MVQGGQVSFKSKGKDKVNFDLFCVLQVTLN